MIIIICDAQASIKKMYSSPCHSLELKSKNLKILSIPFHDLPKRRFRRHTPRDPYKGVRKGTHIHVRHSKPLQGRCNRTQCRIGVTFLFRARRGTLLRISFCGRYRCIMHAYRLWSMRRERNKGVAGRGVGAGWLADSKGRMKRWKRKTFIDDRGRGAAVTAKKERHVRGTWLPPGHIKERYRCPSSRSRFHPIEITTKVPPASRLIPLRPTPVDRLSVRLQSILLRDVVARAARRRNSRGRLRGRSAGRTSGAFEEPYIDGRPVGRGPKRNEGFQDPGTDACYLPDTWNCPLDPVPLRLWGGSSSADGSRESEDWLV